MSAHRPPRLAERLLAAVIRDPAWRDTVVGDLHEEFLERARRVGAARASLWYCWLALRLAVHFDRREPTARAGAGRARFLGDTLMQDFRLAFRQLVKQPGLTATVVVALAFGLGANSAIFSFIDALLLRPLTFAGADRVVMIGTSSAQRDDKMDTVAPADFLDWRRDADAFEHLAALEWWDANLAGRDDPERVQGFRVSASYFSIFGATPAAGRTFLPGDELPGAPRAAILGHGLWLRRFGGDRAIVGQTITIDREPYTVVGVAPAGFAMPRGAEVWAPLVLAGQTAGNRHNQYLTVFGRLRDGRTLQDASAQMALVDERLRAAYPATNAVRTVRVWSLADGLMDEGVGPVLTIWQLAAVGLLLIACANVANLLLARGAERQRELAVRLAVGSSRMRLIRQLMVESLVLALAGGAAAVVLAYAGVEAIRRAMPASVARFVSGWDQLDVDGRSLLATIALSVVAAVIFGTLPALKTSRLGIVDVLREGGRSDTAGAARVRLRALLAGAQIALAVALLSASLLSIAAARRAMFGPQGYDPDGVLTAALVLPDGAYDEAETRRHFIRQVLADLQAAPGVQSAAVIDILPSGGSNTTTTVQLDGVVDRPEDPRVADSRSVSAPYFATMRIPLVHGRLVAETDREDSLPVAVVSESFARRHWPGEDAVGRRVRLGRSQTWLTVVGVCGDVVHDWFRQRRAPTVYRPYAQAPRSNNVFLVRTSGDPASLAPSVRSAVRRADPYQPIGHLRTLRTVLSDRAIGLSHAAWLLSILGGMALFLSALGIYSVMAYLTSRRTQEFGVRIALGATRQDVIGLTIRQAAGITGGGVVAGLAAGAGLGRLMQGMMFGAVSFDPVLVVLPALALALVALTAGYIPARRAARVDPMVALRAE